MSNAHTFTIVTPNLNQGQYLVDNIDSVVSQGESVQQLLFDGGSSDTSLSILKQHQHKLSFWASEKDSGQSHAINKGLRIATGEYVSWLNADDFYLPDVLNQVRNVFAANHDIGVVHGSAILVDAHNCHKGSDQGQIHGLPHRYYAGMCFPQPASFFRSSVLKDVGLLTENLHYGMDYEFFLRIKLKGFAFHRLAFPVAAYRLHQSSKTVSAPLKFAQEWIQIYNNFLHDEPSALPIQRLLSQLGLYLEPTNHYPREQFLCLDDLRHTLLYCLHYQAFFRYQSKDYSRVRQIIRSILVEFPFTRLSLPMIRMYISAKLKDIKSL
jgi:GT2 family glycosyltransferase